MSKGFSKIPHGFHKRLCELSGIQLKVWLAHRCMEGRKGISFPSLALLAEYTGADESRIRVARKWLRDNGWLTSTKQKRTKHGHFSVPVEHTTIPEAPCVQNVLTMPNAPSLQNATPAPSLQNASAVDIPSLQNATTAVGQNATTVAVAKCNTEVDPIVLEVDPCEDFKKKREREREREVEQPAAASASAEPKPSPAPSSFSSSKAAQDSGQEKPKLVWNMPSVENVITLAKDISSNRDITFSKNSKVELLTALQSINPTRYEIVRAVRVQLSLCTDDTSYAIFGSQFAANLVSSVRHLRQQDADYKQQQLDKELGKQWVIEFKEICDDMSVNLDEWLSEHTDVGDAWKVFDELVEQAEVRRANLAAVPQSGERISHEP